MLPYNPEYTDVCGVEIVSDHMRNERLSRVEPNRRSFMAKFAGAVFAAPVISSFALDGIAQAQPDRRHHLPNGYSPNGHYPNGHHPNGHHPNGHHPNGHMPNGHLPNGHHGEHGCDDPFWWVFGECFPFDNHRSRRRGG
jgi:hypothetical protein